MFSALKKLTKGGDDRCPAPIPMSSSLQKKFSRGVHYNMKILIKGDRNVGKSCLLQRLQGGTFIEEYVPTDQIQVAPIHWTYKNTDHIVKVEVWEVVDKGRTKKKPPLGLKLENQSAPTEEDGSDTPVLDATFLDVYKNATGVILMLDITKPWTFEYVVKELARVPADLPVVVLGNHCDMQHHRQVHPHHIEQALHEAKMTRTAPVRYAESSMRNGFGLRLLHKFLSVPFLKLQRTSLLEQLQRNQKDNEEIEKELDDFQNSEESHYNSFLDRLANKRKQNTSQEPRPAMDRSPSIVLGAGKPIIPPGVNPLLAQSINPKGIKAHYTTQMSSNGSTLQGQEKQAAPTSVEKTPSRPPQTNKVDSVQITPTIPAANDGLDEFYAGTLDSSFLEDLTPISQPSAETNYDSDSDEDDAMNPKVTVDEDFLDIDFNPDEVHYSTKIVKEETKQKTKEDLSPFMTQLSLDVDNNRKSIQNDIDVEIVSRRHHIRHSIDSDFPMWAGDSSARRSPEGVEDPDNLNVKESNEKIEKKHKKKKSKDREKGDSSDKSDKKEKRHKHKKSKGEKKPHPQQNLLAPEEATEDLSNFDIEGYDSI